MTSTEQLIISAYCSQLDGLCERQNRIVKDPLVKVLDGNPGDWPSIIEIVSFAYRASKHTSTDFSPYFLYNRELTLPIDVEYGLVGIEREWKLTLFSTKKDLMPCLQLRSP